MVEAAPEGVENPEPLGPGIWRGRRDGRPVIARRVAFGSEAVALRAVEHPSLPRLLDVSGGFALFESVDGETLERRLDRVGALEAREAVDVLRAAAGALGALARAGLRHGALRPSNVMFAGRGVVFVDPVWSRAVPDAYLSPEEERGGRPDLRSDYYALGLLLHEMLVGLPAFVKRDPSRGALPFDVEGIPPELARVGRGLTQPDPALRLSDAGELLRALDASDAPPPPAPPPPSPKPAPARRGSSVVFALFALALLFGVGVLKARKAPPPPKPKIVVTIPPVEIKPFKIDLPPLPPPPPGGKNVPETFLPLEEELARAEAFAATADALAAARDYARLDGEAPALEAPAARARLAELLAPHRRAARAWTAALAQLDAMKGRALSVTLRDGTRLFGRLEEVEPKLKIGGKEASVKDLDALSIARMAMSGRGAATDLEVLAFALFEKDAAAAKLAAEDIEPDPWAAPRLAALVKEAEEKAARDKRERDAELALRSADRAFKDYRPEMYADVAELHAGTAAGATAREKAAALRKSLARWAFNDGKAAGWSGELKTGGRWGGAGFHLRSEGASAVEGAPLFAWTPGARLRLDYRTSFRAKLVVTLEGEGTSATAVVDAARSSSWRSFDRPLADFEGAFADGAPVKALRVEAKAESGAAALSLDSIELYLPPD